MFVWSNFPYCTSWSTHPSHLFPPLFPLLFLPPSLISSCISCIIWLRYLIFLSTSILYSLFFLSYSSFLLLSLSLPLFFACSYLVLNFPQLSFFFFCIVTFYFPLLFPSVFLSYLLSFPYPSLLAFHFLLPSFHSFSYHSFFLNLTSLPFQLSFYPLPLIHLPVKSLYIPLFYSCPFCATLPLSFPLLTQSTLCRFLFLLASSPH